MHVGDSLSGVKRFRYQTKNGNTWSSYSGWIYGTGKTITLSQQGRNQIHIQEEDKAGNYHDTYSGYYYIDKTAPTLVSDGISNYRYQNGNDYWFKSSHVSINSASRQENSAYGKVNWGIVPKVSGDSYNIEYYFIDRAGNSRGYGDTGKNLRVDGVAPFVSFNPNSHRQINSNVNVGVKVSDSLSGVMRFRYRQQNGSTWGSYSNWISGTSSTIALSKEGRNRIQIEAEDHVGNISNIDSGYYYIDKTLVVILAKIPLRKPKTEPILYYRFSFFGLAPCYRHSRRDYLQNNSSDNTAPVII